MHLTSRRQAVTVGNSCRNVLFAHRNKGSGGKSFPRRFLLAFGRGRRPQKHAHLPKLPEACPLQQIPTRRSLPHTPSLVPRAMGHIYSGTLANSSRQFQVRSSRCGLLLKVDRSQSSSRHHSRHIAKNFLAKHRMPLRRTQRSHSGQRQTI